MKNLWESAIESRKSYPVLNQALEADVCIVGGGITGMTAALQLSKAGQRVVLLEAETLAYGTTGSSSNHLNTQIDFGYRNVEKKFDKEVARLVATSRSQAIDYIEKNVKEYDIDCDFKRLDGFLYTEGEDEVETLEREYEACLRAGLAVNKARSLTLPFAVKMGLHFDRQAAFNAIKYVAGMARQVEGLQGRIFENSRVVDLDRDTMTIQTTQGSVKAAKVFLATHIPLFINVHQSTSAPYRSYMIAIKVTEYPQDALYWDMFDPYHYTRIYEQQGQKWLAIGGADHKTGHDDPQKDYYKDLEAYARVRYDVQEVSYRWTQQYFEPSDGLPFIGISPFGSTYMATGFSGDGLVYGTVAGILVADQIMGNNNPWIKAYDSKRFKPFASAEEFIKHNMDVARHLISDRFTSKDISGLKPGQGVVIRKDGHNYAVSKDEGGKLHACSAACSHMGCIVHWNHLDKTWNCGCHGSQFSASGKVNMGPATHDLDQADQELFAKDQ